MRWDVSEGDGQMFRGSKGPGGDSFLADQGGEWSEIQANAFFLLG